MDAKCPNCEKAAFLDDDLTKVKCSHCGYEAKYDDYLTLMEKRVREMAENIRFDRPGF